ncbi:MAG TPA: metallophosphoesterase [Humisphaera sp.]
MPSNRPSRRDVMKLGAAAALSAGLWPGALRAADAAAGDFRFLCVNDLHCMDDESAKWLESRVIGPMKDAAKAAKDPVDFCLVVGDLAEGGTAKEIATVRDLFGGLGVPVHVVPGNHDYVADKAGGGAADSRAAYDDLFPGKLNYAFEHKGWQFVGLDSTQGAAYQKTRVGDATLRWLDDRVPKLDKARPTVLFTHFPMGEKVTYRPANADDVLARFADHNLRAVLNGHFHGHTARQAKAAAITTSPCCALKRQNHDKTPAKGYHVCHAKADGTLTREFVEVRAGA